MLGYTVFMLTRKETEYLNVCVKYLGHEGSRADLAAKLELPYNTVLKAVKWGEQHGFFREAAFNKMEQYRVDIVKTIQFLERRLMAWEKFVDFMEGGNERIIAAGDPEELKQLYMVAPSKYLPLIKELREQRLMLAELDGVVKRSNAIVDNRKQTNVFFLPTGTTTKEWEMEAKRFVEGEQQALPGDYDEPIEVEL